MSRPRTPTSGINRFGYRRVWCRTERRLKMEHRVVWEAVHGPIPQGMEVHHVNGDKLDNRVENLRIVSRLEHKRIHSGCELLGGVWWKRCRGCEEIKPASAFYGYPGRKGLMSRCKACCIKSAVVNKQRRKPCKPQAGEKAPALAGAGS